jgi:uncharacterized protein (TIGR02596 family)
MRVIGTIRQAPQLCLRDDLRICGDSFFVTRAAGFSLVELIVVIGIIAILAGAVMVAGGPLMRASQLSQGAQMVAEQLQLAHQYAMSKDTNVEVRFYQYADTSLGEVPGTYSGTTGGRYRALQIFALHDNLPSVPLGTIQRLPKGVCMDSGLTLSSLFANTKTVPWVPATDPQPSIPSVGTQYQCAYVQFLGTGGTNLNPQSSWFLTVHYYRVSGSSDNLTTPPNNFFTIQVNPINGHIRTFRP